MNYLYLLRLVSPEAILAFTALMSLGLGLATTRLRLLCPVAAAAGLIGAGAAILALPMQAALPIQAALPHGRIRSSDPGAQRHSLRSQYDGFFD